MPVFELRPVLWEPLCAIRHYLGSDLEAVVTGDPMLDPITQIDLRTDGKVEIIRKSGVELLKGSGRMRLRASCYKCGQLNALHSDDPDYEPKKVDYEWELVFEDGSFVCVNEIDGS
jgi:hypothetical protein